MASKNEVPIWNFLMKKINNPYGVAGLMGNLYAESGLNPRNLQNSGNKKHSLSDDDSRDYNYYVGRALLIEDVFNLVTKKFSFGKPTYETLMTCLYDMEWHCRNLGIKKLAMPRIGCGLDRLKWERVREMIKEVFADDDIDILVCYQKGE